MTGSRLCKVCGDWHKWDEPKPDACIPERARSAAYIRVDGMSDTLCPADGKIYDSRSRFERAVKDAGCVILGNDAPTSAYRPPSMQNVERDIKTAFEQLSARNNR